MYTCSSQQSGRDRHANIAEKSTALTKTYSNLNMYAQSTCKYSAFNLLSCNTFNWKNYKLYNGNVPNIRYFTHQSMY